MRNVYVDTLVAFRHSTCVANDQRLFYVHVSCVPVHVCCSTKQYDLIILHCKICILVGALNMYLFVLFIYVFFFFLLFFFRRYSIALIVSHALLCYVTIKCVRACVCVRESGCACECLWPHNVIYVIRVREQMQVLQ